MAVLTKSFESKVEYDNESINLYYTHIKVPDNIFKLFSSKNVKRVVFTLNGGNQNHGAFIPVGDGSYFLMAGKELLKKNKLAIEDKVTVKLWPDESQYGMPISEELEEILSQDPDGSELFHKLTPGKIRSLIYHVGKYKSSDKRVEKGVIILEHLKANEGKLDWKMLNEAFKQGL